MLRFAEVPMGDGGVVACARCATPRAATHRPAVELIAAVESAVAAWDGPAGPNVSLVGAEPFDHPELPAIVAAAVAAGVSRLRVETAGAALALGDNAPGAQAAGVRHVRVVLLGGRHVHDSLAGAAGLHDAACAGMRAWTRAAESAGTPVFLSGLVPVCAHNVSDVAEAVAAFAAAGAREVTLRAADGPDVAEAAPWLAAACDTGTVNRVWVRVEGFDGAALPDHLLHLTPALPRARA